MDDDYAREYAWYLDGCRLLGWEDPLDGDEFDRLYRKWVNNRRRLNDLEARLAQLSGVRRAAVVTVERRTLTALRRVDSTLGYVQTAVLKGRGGDGSTPEGALLRPGPTPRGGSAASTLPPERIRDP
jgi:hypothetical protein